jgi:hypothetical protein
MPARPSYAEELLRLPTGSGGLGGRPLYRTLSTGAQTLDGCPNKEPEGLSLTVFTMTSPSLPAPPLLVDLLELAAVQPSRPDCRKGAASPALGVMKLQSADRPCW